MQSRSQIEKALGQNMENQQNLAARLQELGRNVQMPGGAGEPAGLAIRWATRCRPA